MTGQEVTTAYWKESYRPYQLNEYCYSKAFFSLSKNRGQLLTTAWWPKIFQKTDAQSMDHVRMSFVHIHGVTCLGDREARTDMVSDSLFPRIKEEHPINYASWAPNSNEADHLQCFGCSVEHTDEKVPALYWVWGLLKFGNVRTVGNKIYWAVQPWHFPVREQMLPQPLGPIGVL